MKVYIVFLFDKHICPSTNECIVVFSTEEKAKKYVELHKTEYDSLQELYYEAKVVN